MILIDVIENNPDGSIPDIQQVSIVGIPEVTITQTPVSTNFQTSDDSTNGVVVKDEAGILYSVVAINNTNSLRYLKVYNSSVVVVGSTIPVFTFILGEKSDKVIEFGTKGLNFINGICTSITGGEGISDTTPIGVGEVNLGISYA